MIETFEKWYNNLTYAQQKELMDYIFNKKIKPLNEGFFTGPIVNLNKGIFTGPIGSERVCPTCKRAL